MEIEGQGISRAHLYSEDKISILRERLTKELGTDCEICVVTVGSLARREASEQSDIDFFIIYRGDKKAAEGSYKGITSVLSSVGLRMPSATGAFGQLVEVESLLINIGGLDDTTETLTRRMLLLLECEWLFNETFFKELFNDAINNYVGEKITQHQLCRFLLNDLIRYYRTICVDFEFKTTQQGKSWGDRNIKLLFSRKLLYFSGILVIAETAQHTYESKREILKKMLSKTPIDRIKQICGVRADKVLSCYDVFLQKLSDEKVRDIINKTNIDRDTHHKEFRNFKNQGHHFSWELSRLLTEVYDVSHPINHALRF